MNISCFCQKNVMDENKSPFHLNDIYFRDSNLRAVLSFIVIVKLSYPKILQLYLQHSCAQRLHCLTSYQ
jgi:hypothetical protein